MLLEKRFLRTIDALRAGRTIPLRLELWNGRRFDLSGEPKVTIAIPAPAALRYFVSPDLSSLGEAFVEGHIRVEGAISEVFKVGESLARAIAARPRALWRRSAHHSAAGDRKAVQYHYDVANEFYSLFLDPDMVYSCAYYRHESDTLEAAQQQKLDHILTKLRVQPGERLLDIGCGWGALVMRAAARYGAIATGITLSKNQFEFARERIRAAGLQDRCRVELCDYRDLPGLGTYDKVASVGMFEHVGLKNLPAYFSVIHSLLRDDGLALNHGITTSDPDSGWMGLGAGEFIDRYVFPDGELPHLSLALGEMARAGLEAYDIESLRRHYAHTCHAWSSRLEANREQASRIAGERRYRIWQIYLAGCAYGFAHGWMNVYQVLAGRAQCTAAPSLPLTRDYMYPH
ncbi:MAG: class I SAM-dependent methyltransferase [Proteobacteria bacterium]|nr:class I SAM-dependent methyltransferase [Pseudomonadota bacterium]